jgi:hypothetical protein
MCFGDTVAHPIMTWLQELAGASVVVKVLAASWSDACQMSARHVNCAHLHRVL